MIPALLCKLFGASWKTTALGYIAAVGNVVLPLLQGDHVSWKQIASSAGIAVFGRLVADATPKQ